MILETNLDDYTSPPWIAFPESLGEGDLCFRMDPGQYYINMFATYFCKISEDERNNLKIDYPEPDYWTGFYDHIFEDFIYYSNKSLIQEIDDEEYEAEQILKKLIQEELDKVILDNFKKWMDENEIKDL